MAIAKHCNFKAARLRSNRLIIRPAMHQIQIQQFRKAYFGNRWTFTTWPWPF